MPGLVPGIHVLCTEWQAVDGRDKHGHDAWRRLCRESVEFGTNTAVNRGELPRNPLKRMAFRATLRDPDGFGHIDWMPRSVGLSVPRRAFGVRRFNLVYPWGSGE
jgi:hypothetical protein